MGKVAKVGIFAGKKISINDVNLKSPTYNFLKKTPFEDICTRVMEDQNSVEDLEILFNQAPISLLVNLVNSKGFSESTELVPVLHLPIQKRLVSEDRNVVFNTFLDKIDSLASRKLSLLIGIQDYSQNFADIKWVLDSLKLQHHATCNFLSPPVSSIINFVNKKTSNPGDAEAEFDLILKKLKEIGISETFGSVIPAHSENLRNLNFPINYLHNLDKFPSGREFVESLLRLKGLNPSSWTCGFSKHCPADQIAKYDSYAIRAFAIARLILKDTQIRIRSYSLSMGILDLLSHLGLNSVLFTAVDNFTADTAKLYLHDDVERLNGNWK